MTNITAINKKYQAMVNRFIQWDTKYNTLVDLDTSERKQEQAYNKASELWGELPKREQKNITKSIDTIGY